MAVTNGRRSRARATRALALAGPLAGGVLGLALPGSVLLGGLAWLGFLVGSLAGWGALASRAAGLDREPEADLGMRLAWGAAAYLAIAGWLLALGLLTAPVQLGLLVIGAGLHAWRVIAPPPAAAEPVPATATAPASSWAWWPWALVGLIAAVVAVDVLAAVVKSRANPYDDDIAYTAFVRRLLQVGDLDESFSFRRISAYGGQTVLLATAAVRGTLANLHLVDAGLFRLITLALVVGLARARDTDRVVGGLVVLVLAVLPDTSINTTSHWTGLALFLALYRTTRVALLRDDLGAWALVGVVAAAAASLRQNHIVVVAIFVAVTLRFTSARGRWRAATAAAIGGLITIAPYGLAAWRTCGTPLYPLIGGGANPDIHFAAEAWTWWRELQLVIRVALEPNPIRVLLPLLVAVLVVSDRRTGRPLVALAIACGLGWIATIHGFTLSDPSNLWRYVFGFVTAWVVVVVVEMAPARDGAGGVTAPPLARLVVAISLIVQLAVTGPSMARTYAPLGRDLAAAHGGERSATSTRGARYQRLQAAAPAGVRLAVLVDQPALLDYRRQRIVNLDTPGYVSEGAALPSFVGAEAVATYFREHGIRYLAFVRGDRSTYYYRRRLWVLRTFFEDELLRVMGAYMVDFLDTVDELARTRTTLFEEDGQVLLDLEEAR